MSKLIETSYTEYKELVQYLLDEQQISLSSLADNNLKKNLILCSASYFENKITNDLIKYFHDNNKDTICIKEFLINKGLNRQYHTLFDWEGKNANKFFSLFGQEFKNYMVKTIKDDKELELSVKSFLELGNERNRLVHQNFVQYSIEKTLDEIYKLFQEALPFVTNITKFLDDFHEEYKNTAEDDA